jgi:hypothetical protein
MEEESAAWTRGVSCRYEAAFLTKDGCRVPVVLSARPVFEEGRFGGVLFVFVDVADHRRKAHTAKSVT